MAPDIRPPFRLRRNAESFGIQDSAGRELAYVYFENEPGRRSITRRLTEADALEVARTLARSLATTYGHGWRREADAPGEAD
jgi:hypothetical protein